MLEEVDLEKESSLNILVSLNQLLESIWEFECLLHTGAFFLIEGNLDMIRYSQKNKEKSPS